MVSFQNLNRNIVNYSKCSRLSKYIRGVAKILYEYGFASKPTSERMDDGFFLIDTCITAVLRCTPPKNKPTKDELDNCFNFLEKEFRILKNVKVAICLGKIAFQGYYKLLKIKEKKFYHNKIVKHENLFLISSYHPSRQNTQTGRLTWKQWKLVFSTAKNLLNKNTKEN